MSMLIIMVLVQKEGGKHVAVQRIGRYSQCSNCYCRSMQSRR